MFPLLFLLATLSTTGDYLDDYKPEPGDRVVLAGDEKYESIAVGADYFAIDEIRKYVRAGDLVGIRQMVEKGRGTILDGETPALFLKMHEEYKEADLAEVRILEGPQKDAKVCVSLARCRKLDPAKVQARLKAEADAKAWVEAKAKRKPLDAKVIAADLKTAIAKAKADASKLGTYRAAQAKEKMVKDAIDRVRRRHVADLAEINDIATREGVFVIFDGQKYDVAGNKVR